MATATAGSVLDVRGLEVEYATPRGKLLAVKGVDLEVDPGEIVGLIGESGSGKTTAAMACLRLLPGPGRVLGGAAVLNGGVDLLSLDEQQLRRIRWKEVALIPQGALNSLNPVMRVRTQILETIRVHEGRRPKDDLDERVVRLFNDVGLPERALRMYPHELSGGMKQRVCIAMAIALRPSLIVADEPTSALDVIVQRVVAETLLEIKEKMGVSILLIGHDIGLMAQLADRVSVMYGGRIVESGPTAEVLNRPRHPYTQLLIDCVPAIGRPAKWDPSGAAMRNLVADRGCPFSPRCRYAMQRCVDEVPALAGEEGHLSACFLDSGAEKE